jgi:hypothetical protein
VLQHRSSKPESLIKSQRLQECIPHKKNSNTVYKSPLRKLHKTAPNVLVVQLVPKAIRSVVWYSSTLCLVILRRFDATGDALISSIALTKSFLAPSTLLALVACFLVCETRGHKAASSTCCSCWEQTGATVAPSIFVTSSRKTRSSSRNEVFISVAV